MNKVLKGVSLQDRISVPTERTMTDAGQMIVPCAFARTGTLIYKGSSLGLVDQADELIEVHRKEEDVFAMDSMESFRSAPITLGHPKSDEGKAITVDASNAKELQVGMLEGMPVRDEDLLTGTLVITNQEAIDKIEEGTVELSAGYTCDMYEDDGNFYQTNIKANHIAIVDKGRAGSSCSIADEAEDLEDGNKVTDSSDGVEGGVEEVPAEPAKSEIKDISDEFVPQAEGEVAEVQIEAAVEDMNEVEAAEAVALHEENETVNYQHDAEWAKNYAEDAEAMVKAHAEVAKAARKIANKKAKSVNDSADEGGDTYLTTDVAEIVVALDIADETIVKLTDELEVALKALDENVEALCNVILLAKDMTDLEDFAGKSVNDIRALVVADVLDIDLSEKSEAYIDARFDILCEDSGNADTPMSKLLKNQIVNDVAPEPYVDPVAEARQKSIDRNNKI